MRRSLLIFLVACTLVVAMVPRHRRAENSGSDDNENGTNICAATTPCAWSVYKKGFKNLIELNFTNSYCVCAEGQQCVYARDDEDSSSYVFQCSDTS